jgi:hypothetical protein
MFRDNDTFATPAELASMWDALPRPDLSSWTEDETAAHRRSVERIRRGTMQAIYGGAR